MSEPSNTAYAFKWINGDHSPFTTIPYQYTFTGWQPYIYDPMICNRGYHFCYPNVSDSAMKNFPHLQKFNTWHGAALEWQAYGSDPALWVVEVDVDTVKGDEWFKGVTSTFRFVECISKAYSVSGVRRAVGRGLSKYGVENFLA